MGYEKPELGKETGKMVPSFRVELGTRLREVEKRFKNRAEAARAAGVAKSTLQNWIEGKADPSFQGLAALAKAADISMDWLATGRQPDTPDNITLTQEIDGKLMGLALEGAKKLYAEENARLDDRSAGELATRVYAETLEKCEGSDDPDDRRAALQLVLSKLRRDLRSTDMATQSKHQA